LDGSLEPPPVYPTTFVLPAGATSWGAEVDPGLLCHSSVIDCEATR